MVCTRCATGTAPFIRLAAPSDFEHPFLLANLLQKENQKKKKLEGDWIPQRIRLKNRYSLMINIRPDYSDACT